MILFLDFDGVLHPRAPRRDRADAENKLFAYLPRLEGVLRDFPDWQIVIASSWRQYSPWPYVIKEFSADIATRIIGATPVLMAKEPPYPKHPRFDEVLSYLTTNGHQTTRWIALDDESTLFPPSCPNLILCCDGFREAEEIALRTAMEPP
jgi:hypothetical protein